MLACDKNITYLVKSFNPKYKGVDGDKGAKGVDGDKGIDGLSKNLGGEGPKPFFVKIYPPSVPGDVPHRTFISATVGDFYRDAAGNTLMETGDYFVLFRGAVRLMTQDVYVDYRIRYNGSEISGTVKTVGHTAHASIAGSHPFGLSLAVQSHAHISVTDLNHVLDVQFSNLSTSKPDSAAEAYAGHLVIFKVPAP